MKEYNIFHNFKTEADILNYLEAAWEEKDVEFLQYAVADAVAGWRKLQENGKDKYDKQRKWIGRLCKFWDDDESFWKIGILVRINPQSIDGKVFIYRSPDSWERWCGSWKHCEPLASNDKLIYKGEKK